MKSEKTPVIKGISGLQQSKRMKLSKYNKVEIELEMKEEMAC